MTRDIFDMIIESNEKLDHCSARVEELTQLYGHTPLGAVTLRIMREQCNLRYINNECAVAIIQPVLEKLQRELAQTFSPQKR